MSGQTDGIYQSQKNIVSNGIIPSEPNVYTFPVDLSAGTPVIVDLKPLFNMNRIKGVQGIYIDNSQSGVQVFLSTTCGQVIGITARNQMICPLFLSADGTITITPNSSGAGPFNLTLTNFAVPAAVWTSS
jgi:hypothetical protein